MLIFGVSDYWHHNYWHHITIHTSPTKWRVLDRRTYEQWWRLCHSSNYMVPRHSSNYTSLLQNTDSNAIYIVQKTVPCYYSSHHLDHAMQKVGCVNFGKIIGLIVLHFFTLPVGCFNRLPAALIFHLPWKTGVWCNTGTHTSSKNVDEAIVSIRSKAIQSQVESDTLVCKPSVSDYALHYTLLTLNYCVKTVKEIGPWVQRGFIASKQDNTNEEELHDLEE